MSLLWHIENMQTGNYKNAFSDNKAMIYPKFPDSLEKKKGSICSLYCDSIGIDFVHP